MSSEVHKRIAKLTDRNFSPAHYKYHAGLCGIGYKTSSTLDQIKDSTGNLITSPSLDLVNESANRLSNTEVISSENDVKQVANVLDEILSADRNPENDPDKMPKTNILAHNQTTLTAISRMTSLFGNVVNTHWNLIADEGFNNTVTGYGFMVHPIMHDNIIQLFHFVEFPDQPLAYKLTAKDIIKVNALAAGTFEDDTLRANDKLRDICKAVINHSKHVLISKDLLKNVKAKLDLKQSYKFEVLSVIRADIFNIFKEVTFLLAHFPRSELAIALKIQGINIKDYTVLGEAEGIYRNSDRVTIKYFVPDGYSWSHKLANKKVKSKTNMDKVIDGFIHEVDKLGEPFIWNTWTDYRNEIEERLDKLDSHEHKLNPSLYGVNHLSHYTAVAHLKARNMGDGRNTISHFGVSYEDMDFAGSVLDAYQAVMRSDLRNLDSNKSVTVIVPDRRTVDFLKTMFPDANTEFLHYWDIQVKEKSNNVGGRPCEYKHPDGSSVSRNARQTFTRKGLDIKDFPVWLSNSKYKAEHKK